MAAVALVTTGCGEKQAQWSEQGQFWRDRMPAPGRAARFKGSDRVEEGDARRVTTARTMFACGELTKEVQPCKSV